MAIQLEFINFIVPVQVIEQKYSGGWDAYRSDHSKSLGRVTWYDDHLVRSGGAMDAEMVDIWIDKWTKLGFEATGVIEGVAVWTDLCIVDASGFSEHDCPWLSVDGAERTAWLRETEAGEVVGRDQFRL